MNSLQRELAEEIAALAALEEDMDIILEQLSDTECNELHDVLQAEYDDLITQQQDLIAHQYDLVDAMEQLRK